jgi:hypothetical protein
MVDILFYLFSMFLAVIGFFMFDKATGILQEAAALSVFLLAVMFLIGCFYY